MDVAIEPHDDVLDVMTGATQPDVTDVGETMSDLTARRVDVVRRLLERGVPVRTLRALLPDWDPLIQEASSSR